MKRAFVALLLLALSMPAAAAATDDCESTLTHLGALYQLRAMMMRSGSSYDVDRYITARVNDLREPLAGGGYRWVRWVRPSGGEGPVVKKGLSVKAIDGSGDPDVMEASGDHVYGVRVVVPRKRSLTKANEPLWVGTVNVTYLVNGRERTREEKINAWMNPDTSRTIDLGAIADRVEVSLQTATKAEDANQSLVEIHLRQAVAEDDPANPAFSTIRMLERVRVSPDPATIEGEIAAIERSLFPGAESFPILTLVNDLRRADEWMRSSKPEEQEKGNKLMKDTLRRLR